MRYKATFNWYGEIHEVWTDAKLPNSAFNKATVKLAKKLGRTKGSVRNYLHGKGNSYNIERKPREEG